MDFIDLKTQYSCIEKGLMSRIRRVLEHGRYIMGPEVAELEEILAEFAGVRHCIGVSSGTDALLAALLALDVDPGDEIITTAFSFIATAEVIALLRARPVFVDIDPMTYNIDPDRIEAAITPKTKAILAVSLYGQCADFDAINAIADRHGLAVVEDGAQSFGAAYKGRRSCGLSTIGCTSFFPSKPLGGYGDGGACFTNHEDLAKAMRQIRVHGQDRRYHHPRLGINGRLDTLQAAVLLEKMTIFPEEIARRQRLGNHYSELINARCPGVRPPFIAAGNTSVYAQYTVQVEDREGVREKLNEAGIPTAIHYPLPLHRQPALQTDEFDLRVSERVAQRVISLPMHPYLSEAQQSKVVDLLAKHAI